MTLPVRTNPFGEMTRFDPFSGMEGLLRSLGRRSPLSRDFDNAMEMRLDVNEDDNDYIINVDMPGVRKEDIDVSVQGNQVSIRAEINRELSQGKRKELYSERYSGQAYRAFTLPVDVDASKAKATYDGGVLCLTLPKSAGASARHLPIN